MSALTLSSIKLRLSDGRRARRQRRTAERRAAAVARSIPSYSRLLSLLLRLCRQRVTFVSRPAGRGHRGWPAGWLAGGGCQEGDREEGVVASMLGELTLSLVGLSNCFEGSSRVHNLP